MAEKQRGVSGLFELPGNLKVRRTVNQGNGIFTTKAIRPGIEIFTSKPYAFAICGITLDDVKTVCSHCLKSSSTGFHPVECTKCKAVGYCSKECQGAASQLHNMECKGLLELEKLRGKKDLNVQPPLPSGHDPQEAHMWPPTVAEITARVLNRKVLQTKEKWGISYLVCSTNATTIEDANFVKPYAKPLLHESVSSDDDICDAFCRVAPNYVGVASGVSHRVRIIAVYLEYSLLNHSCQPNCSYASEARNQTMSIYALTDIQQDDPLFISYLSREKMLLHGTARRKKLLEVFRFECSCSACLDEAVPGSNRWLLDQKKKSFIVPWTQETANDIIEEGIKDLEKMEFSTSEENWARVAEIARATLKKNGRFLSKSNIVCILTSLSLMNALDHLGEVQMALQLAEALLPYIKEYDSNEMVSAHLARMSCYSFTVGKKQEGLQLFRDSINLFPRNMNYEGYLHRASMEAIKVGGSSVSKLIASKLQGITLYCTD